uniref:RNA polymerase sigma factor n=1 Tax=Clostridium sp. NkU-1 TaxID=1095009 RepID=UPI000A58611A
MNRALNHRMTFITRSTGWIWKYKISLSFVFFEEMSLKEIAEITGANLNTVKARLYRGLKMLKQNIQEVNL